MHRSLVAALAGGAVVWLALLVAAPVALSHGSPALPWFVYEAASLVCHQRAERSFHLAGVQLPVCARCFGLYASGAAAATFAALVSVAPGTNVLTREARIVLLAAALPTAVTVAFEWFGLASPSNLTRALCSIPLGATAAWLFIRALRAEAPPRQVPQMRYHS